MSTPRSRPSAEPPIWAQPEPGARRPRLTREQIATTALAIADAAGFEAVSMRRLAAELDVGTMTLYYYVRTKEDLMVLMDDALMGEVLIPPGELPRRWRPALAMIARRSRAVLLRHPWSIRQLEGRGARFGPNGLRHGEQSLAAVADAPLDLEGRFALISTVDDYVFGSVLRWADPTFGAGAEAAANLKNMIEFVAEQIATGEYPEFAAMLGDEPLPVVFARVQRWLNHEQRFDDGLEALLDGLELQIKRRQRAARRTPSQSGRPPRPRRSR